MPDYPIPATAQQAYSPIGEGFESPLDPRENLKGPMPYVDGRAPLLRSVSRGLQDEGPFLRDTKLRLNSRTYWLSQDVFGFESEALTTGGSLAYQSGYIAMNAARAAKQLAGLAATSSIWKSINKVAAVPEHL
ncbi:MAG: hypothetical protein ACR2GC_00405 [Methyloceanibacter sp.]|uniref:hypothetical protein n=1 Tax=Methyloceanibacter sp. TaxID=1965321 RepID=UPI003D9B72CF